MPWVENDEAAPSGGKWVEDDAPPQDTRSDITKAINTGARAAESVGVKAVSGALGAPGDIAELMHFLGSKLATTTGLDKILGAPPPMPINPLPTSREFIDRYSRDVSPMYEPTSKPGQYADRASTGALQAILMGGANLPMALSGAGAGAGSKLGKDLFPNSPWGEALGGLLGGIIPGTAYSVLRPPPSTVARNVLRDATTPLKTAEQLQQDSVGMGLGVLTGPESLNSPYGLSVQRLLEQSPEGRGVRAVMTERGPNAARVTGAQIGAIGDLTPREGMTALESAGNQAIAARMKDRASKTGPFYKPAEETFIPSQAVTPILEKIDQRISAAGAESEAGRALSELRDRVQSTMNGHLAKVGPLDTLYKEFRDRLSRPGMEAASLSGAESSSNGVISSVVGDLGKIVENESPLIAAGRAAHKVETPAVDELAKGLTGDLTNSKTLSQAAATFVNPKNETPADIARAAKALGAKNPQAVPALVQQYLRDKLEAAKAAVGATPSRLGAKFNQATIGATELEPRQAANIEAAVRALPDGNTIWSGMERVGAVYRAQGNRYVPGSPTAYNQIINEGLKDENVIVGAARGVATGGRSWWDAIQNARLRSTYSILDKAFSDPNSVERLMEIAREPNRRRAKILIGTFIGENQGQNSLGNQEQ